MILLNHTVSVWTGRVTECHSVPHEKAFQKNIGTVPILLQMKRFYLTAILNYRQVLGSHRKVSEDVSSDITVADPTDSNVESVNFLKLPVDKYASRSKAAAFRDVLNQIRALSFLYNEEVLENLHSDLLRSLDQLEASAPQEHSLLKEEVKTRDPASKHKKANF